LPASEAKRRRFAFGLFRATVSSTVQFTHKYCHRAVFIHPFEDGNGRIHRFLIHHSLAKLKFAPQGLLFPVSAAMLRDPKAYDAALNAFSGKIMPKIEYDMDEHFGARENLPGSARQK
jgi:fido (protein-threonine AMPylation protein)